MDTITRFNVGSMQVVVVVNEPFWRKLSAQHRAILLAAARAADAEARESAGQADADAYRELKERGCYNHLFPGCAADEQILKNSASDPCRRRSSSLIRSAILKPFAPTS